MGNFRFLMSMAPGPANEARVAVVLAAMLVALGMMARAYTLERRYKGPYTLRAALEEKKWRWAIELAFWETGWLIPVALAMPVRGSCSAREWFLLLGCGAGLWVVCFGGFVLLKRWDLSRALIRYLDMDSAAKQGKRMRAIRDPFIGWFGGEEMERFYKEGYGRHKTES